MREIKFRAVYKGELLDRVFKPFDLYDELTKPCNHDEGEYSLGGLVFEQFTGLHDKSFKDIYEGDIVQINHVRLITDGPIHKPRIASVEWVEDETGFRLVGPDVKSTNPWLYPYSHLEVIGNIHENQELLK